MISDYPLKNTIRFSPRYIPPLKRRDSLGSVIFAEISLRIGDDDRTETRDERCVKKECGATREHSGVACRDTEIIRSCSPLRGGWQSIIV